MNIFELSKEDKELVQEAKDYIARRFVPDKHFVASAGRTVNGEVFVGMNLAGSPRGIDVCGEPSVLQQVIAGDHGNLETIVAVRHVEDGDSYVVSPCGKCREMILRYAPNSMTIVPDQGGNLRKVAAETLLPFKYRQTQTSSK